MAYEFFLNNMDFFIFISILILFLLYKRKNLEIVGSFPFLYMMLYRTRLGLDKMRDWSLKHPNFFKYVSNISIFIGIVGVVLSFFFMLFQVGFIFKNELSVGGAFILPLKTEKGLESTVPVLYVPLIYWIITLFVIMVVHEFAHGVIAERWKIKVKSSGFAFFGIGLPLMPGAFVEPDEKDLNKKSWDKKIAVFGAGSLSNLFFGIIFTILLLGVINPIYNQTQEFEGLHFTQVMNESNLYQYNLSDSKITSINGKTTYEGFTEELKNISTNDNLNLLINNDGEISEYNIKAIESSQNSSKGMIGISNVQFEFKAKDGFEIFGTFMGYLKTLFFWLCILNIMIGIMNLVPLWITDGGQIANVLLNKYFSATIASRLFNIISFIMFFAIIFILKPSLVFNLLNFS